MEDRRIAWVAPHSEHFTRQTLSRIAMYGEAGSVAAGTGQLMEWKVIKNRIIKGLGNLIAIPDKNGYHSLVNVHRQYCAYEQ